MPYHGKKKGPLRGYRRGSTKVLSEEEIARREAARAAGANNTSKGRNVGRTEQPVDPLPGLFSGAQAGYKSLPTAADAQAAAEYRANLEAQQAVPPVTNYPNNLQPGAQNLRDGAQWGNPEAAGIVAGRPDVPVGDLTNAAAPPPVVHPDASPQGQQTDVMSVEQREAYWRDVWNASGGRDANAKAAYEAARNERKAIQEETGAVYNPVSYDPVGVNVPPVTPEEIPPVVNTGPHEQQPLETPAPVVPADTQSEYEAAAGIPEVNQWGTPAEEETDEITPGSSVSLGGTGSMTGTDNGGVSVDDGEGNQSIFSGDQVEAVKGALKEYFGLETGDLKRAIGSYLLSRAAGSSHNGAMQYAGQTTYGGIERRENLAQREKERDELWAREDEKTATANARADRIRAETLMHNASISDRTFMENNIGKYTPDSIKAYLDGGRSDISLLDPTTTASAGVAQGEQTRLSVDGVAGFENQTIYQQTVKTAAGTQEMVTYQDPADGTYKTVPMQQFENIIRAAGGSLDTQVLTRNDRAELAQSFTDRVSSNLDDKLAGIEKKGLSGNWSAGLTREWQKQGYDLTDAQVVASLENLTYQAADIAIAEMAGDKKKRVTDLASIVRNLQLEASAMNANDSVWKTKDGKVAENKIAELSTIMLNEAGGDFAQVKSAFLAYRKDFLGLSEAELNKYKASNKENQFYVYLRDKLGL